jgi:uncharacterized protein YdeI (YjbR/CyaY-like superfamily)
MSTATTTKLPAGTVHDKLPADMREMLKKDAEARATWLAATPLARNEWICLVDSPAKLDGTRERRLERCRSQLSEGQRRPCCWAGCPHRKDKQLSPTQRWVLDQQSKS